MLKKLKLRNVGPAPTMEMNLARRVNLITGGNGLGKSFLLDTAWYALTRVWPQELDDRVASGYEACPRDRKKSARIGFTFTDKSDSVSYGVSYSPRNESWQGQPWRPWSHSIVIYARADGSFLVWDPVRNYWKAIDGVDMSMSLPGYAFTDTEISDGLHINVNDEKIPICSGLLSDWSLWLSTNDENARMMEAALNVLASSQYPGGALKLGPVVRLSTYDDRDIPSLAIGDAAAIPILHASSAVRRFTALAYLLVWSWDEHLMAADYRGQEPTRHFIILVDDIESHLHPRWQRTILQSLRDVVSVIHPKARAQFLVSTHSPLVMASAEPWFDPKKDAWFNLEFDDESSQVNLRREMYALHGTAGNWLTSEAFDLKTDRGSVEAEEAILMGLEMQSNKNAELKEVMEVHERLCKVLPDIDPFWARWCAFVESRGGQP